MTKQPRELFQRWTHSFEEDAASMEVYRPADYDFPAARGRGGIEFQPGGEFIRWAVGRGDTNEPVQGRWREENADVLVIEQPGNPYPVRILQIVELTPAVLKIREIQQPK